MAFTREQIAERAAQEIPSGCVVNLGIGLPTLVASYIRDDQEVWLHSENGLLGTGPFPYEGDEDPQLINAGKQTVTILPGGSCFDSATSFAMIRGGHIDVAFLGAMQVSMAGDLANWSIPGGKTMGIGGAMDLSSGCRRLIVLTTHQSKTGAAKLVAACDFPLTAQRVVDRVITDMAVLDVAGDGFRLVELAPGVSREQLEAATDAPILDASV